jgi:uncharacterized protein (TIGR00369 family)
MSRDPVMDAERRSAILARVATIPIADTLGMRDIVLEDGVCELTVPRERRWDGVFESFHGGLLMTVADSAACFAILTLTGADQALTTTDMNIRFLAPCLTDVRVRARVIKRGRLLCPVTVDLFDAGGTLVAVAQVTYMLLDRRPSRPSEPVSRT